MNKLEEIQEITKGLDGKWAALIYGASGTGKTTLANQVFRPLQWKISDSDKLIQNLNVWNNDPIFLKLVELKSTLEKATPPPPHRTRDQWAKEWDVKLRPFEFDQQQTIGNCLRAKSIWSEIKEEAPESIVKLLFSEKLPGIQQHLPDLTVDKTGIEGYFLSHKRIFERIKEQFFALNYSVLGVQCKFWPVDSLEPKKEQREELDKLAFCHKSPYKAYNYGYNIKLFNNVNKGNVVKLTLRTISQ